MPVAPNTGNALWPPDERLERVIVDVSDGIYANAHEDGVRSELAPDVHRRVDSSSVLPGNLIARQRLFDRIAQPFQARVTAIVAPPGYGKSALATTWLAQSTSPTAFVPLTERDNDPEVLVLTLAAGLGIVGSNGDRFAAIEDCLNAGEVPMQIALDDCDRVRSSESRALLNTVLQNNASAARFLLVGRTLPPVQFGRLRLLDQYRIIDADELSFRSDEISTLAHLYAPECGVSGSFISAIERETGGWAAAIKLVLAAQSEIERTNSDPTNRTGLWEQWIDDYVAEEIAGPLPSQDLARALLLAIATDNEHQPFGTDGTADEMAYPHIESLTIPDRALDGKRRLAPALAESFNRVAPRFPDALEIATQQLLEAGDLNAARDLAMRSANIDLVRLVGERVAGELALRSDFDRIPAWIDQLPADVLRRSRDLQYWNVASEVLRGRIYTDRAANSLLQDDGVPTSSWDDGRKLLLEGVRAYYRSEDDGAVSLLGSALGRLPAEALAERLQAATFLELAHFRTGDDERAARFEEQAIGYAARLPIDELWSWRMTAMARANAYVLRGEVGSAVTKYRTMLAELPDHASFLEGFIRCRLVSLLIEQSDLPGACRELDALEHLAAVSSLEPSWSHHHTLARMRLLNADNRFDEAEALGNAQLPRMRRRPEKSQLVLLLASIWLERGDRAMVRSWLNDVTAFDYPAILVFGEINYRELELDLALSEQQFDHAIQIGTVLLEEALAKRRSVEELRFAMRLAIAKDKVGDSRGANELASSAMTIALRGGFLRSLLVPGVDVVTRFGGVWNVTAGEQRIRQRLHDIAGLRHDDDFVTLSARERELLALVALGRSNVQIANELFISANTVRNHLVRINHRLNAYSRGEAVSRARELGLID